MLRLAVAALLAKDTGSATVQAVFDWHVREK
jgi:hypothetical protein